MIDDDGKVDNTDRYDVWVQHDYFKQSFSPKMPPDWVMIYYYPDDWAIDGFEHMFPGCPDQ